MERPWGLSGPEFLELYWIALAASLAFAIVVRVRLRGKRDGAPAGPLGLYDIAYLTGGPRRVVETSVAVLIGSGALRPSRDGAVRVVGNPVADDTVDQAVLTDAARYRNRTLSLLFTAVSEHDAPRGFGRVLADRGYLVPPEVLKRRYRLAVVPLSLLMAVGAVRWVNGLLIGAPVGWLTLQLVLTGILVGLLLRVDGFKRTARGSRAVAQARAGEGTGGSGVISSAGAAGLVALDGFAHHPDSPLAAAGQRYAALTTGKPPRRSSRRLHGTGGRTLLGMGRAASYQGGAAGVYDGASGGYDGGSSASSCGGGGGCGGGGS
ncbi:TIGR04222 domain-containing membrane protein [Saccharothrix sp. NPDC042600]|uniref:TIGR04222 domain-containing membrane protein n=1 Tax=Saccharothrix TaxID=2071 RepID=UPI0034089B22|nr:TIGR04222 domain-containing membrane protein [Saccharothrix mutabilis subsp. capreolus]